MFEHFLITRFNLKKADWASDKNNQQVLDESWLQDRIQLFERYCLPSVLGQTSLNFKWLIFFEKDSYSLIKQLLDRLKKISFIEPVLLNGYEEFQDGLPDLIKERISKNSIFLVTTRLDNDDALNKQFIAELQKALKEPVQNEVLHFPSGLVLDIGKQNRLASVNYPFNQFVSLVEKLGKEDIKTVFAREHEKWADLENNRALHLRNAWLQVTHAKNMANRFNGSPAFTSRLAAFGISQVKFRWNYDIKLTYSLYKGRSKRFLGK